jgi:hypothetical protein
MLFAPVARAVRGDEGMAVTVSYDLVVFDYPDADLLALSHELEGLVEDQSGWGQPLTPTLSAFLGEVVAAYPRLDQDPDNSPWSIMPTENSSMAGGRAIGFALRWGSHAEAMHAVITEGCRRHNLILYDPQAGTLGRPDPERK